MTTKLTWSEFKAEFIAEQMIYLQEADGRYTVWTQSAGNVFYVYLTETSDKTDFENNYKDDAYEASQVFDIIAVSSEWARDGSGNIYRETGNVGIGDDFSAVRKLHIKNGAIRLEVISSISDLVAGDIYFIGTQLFFYNGSTSIDISHIHSNKTELDLITDGDHDVRTDNPHAVSKSQIGLGNVLNTKHNFTATTNPTTTDDANSGYSIGSVWINISQDKIFVCVDSTVNSAIWPELVVLDSNGDIIIYDGSNTLSLKRGNNSATIDVAGSDNLDLNLDAENVKVNLKGSSSGETFTILDESSNEMIKVDANNTITNNCAENYGSSAPSSPVAGQRWLNSADKLTYIYTGSKWLSETMLKHGVGINSYTVSNQYMNYYDGLVTNTCPIVIPQDITLVGIAIWSSSSSSWTGQVRVFGPNNTILSLAVSSAIYNVDMTSDVDVDAGTRLSVYMNGTSINHPVVEFYYRWRVDS